MVSVAPSCRANSNLAGIDVDREDAGGAGHARACTTDRPIPPRPNTATVAPAPTLAVLSTAPTPVVMPQPSRQTLSSGASRATLASAISGSTVYSEKVEVPM